MNKLFKRLKGFQKAPRNRFDLLKNGLLSQEEFILYELGIAITDWDIEHTDTYGTFEATNKELAEILGWESDSTVSRHKGSLIRKGLFSLGNDGRINPKGFNEWQVRKSTPAKMQESSAKMQLQPANLQDSPPKMQENRTQNNVYSLSSYKGNLSSFKNGEEYQEIWKEMGEPNNFTIDDMKWIDQNV